MTEIERTMTIDEIVKEFDELMTTQAGDTPAKRALIRAAASLGGKFTLPQLVEADVGLENSKFYEDVPPRGHLIGLAPTVSCPKDDLRAGADVNRNQCGYGPRVRGSSPRAKSRSQEPWPNRSARKPTLALAAGFSGFFCLKAQVRNIPSHHLMALLAGTHSHAIGGNGWAA
jgi:hypothetical protein